ncbi:D-alanyl-D-alanine carboxypeptidase [Actinoplanes utahensis]|uniref:D-alanyl-D-alanine carboxypeptidase n=1 Tax=Actinoplanes utahensis TaxID=1869 RepID=A0A0A6X272_ACTUT|nr:D-alanyl-D-alanine carboxypeptidase [Actinoplanes utahensis]
MMYRSLTADETMAKLRGTLAAQQKALQTRSAETTAAVQADAAAQKSLTGVAAAHAAVRERLTKAERTLAAAKTTLSAAQKKRPRDTAAVIRSAKAVEAATKVRDARRKKLAQTAGTLRTAQAGARTTAARVKKALAVQQWTSTTIGQTHKQIAAAGTAAGYAAEAGKLSVGVVAEVRPAFTTKDTTTVYGVTVHRSVAFAFKRMVDDARADGVELSGGGFRTKERQIELRKINGCPDVWKAPSSSCRVPTAIPGRSLHEIGLAVDISSGGRTISRQTKAFTWLQAHARAYGYVNLPSEAWHWSITGG